MLDYKLAEFLGAVFFEPAQNLDQRGHGAAEPRCPSGAAVAGGRYRMIVTKSGNRAILPALWMKTSGHTAGRLDTLTLIFQDHHLVAPEKSSWSSNAANSAVRTNVSKNFASFVPAW
jgi:hypothetical protein